MNPKKNKELIGQDQNIIGIIGKNGKSTTAHLIQNCLKELEINSTISKTAEFSQQMQNKSYEKNVKDVIIEVCKDDIKKNKANCIDFDALIYTNSGKEVDLNETWEMKRPFIALQINKTAIINTDDEQGSELCKMIIAETITYGINQPADIVARNIKLFIDKTRFDLYIKESFACRIEIPFFGLYNVYNILATIAYFLIQGYDPARIAQLLPKIPPLEGRFDTFSTSSSIKIVIDYARTPEAIEALLISLATICEGKIISVIGANGNTSEKTRESIGKNVLAHSNQVIITSDNPRNEEPQSIIYDLIKGTPRQNYRLCIDREKAIELALKLAKPQDVVVLLGKGHEKKQIIKDYTHVFCDKATAKYLVQKFEI